MRRTRARQPSRVRDSDAVARRVRWGSAGSTGRGGGGQAEELVGVAPASSRLHDPLTCNSASRDQLQQGGQITFAIEKNIDSWNLNSSGATSSRPASRSRRLPYVFLTTPGPEVDAERGLRHLAEVTSDNPFTVTYQINPAAVWDDGTPVTADDFIFNWKTQAPAQCPDCETAGNGGYDQISNVVGSNGGKTVTMTMNAPYTDWRSIFGSSSPLYPAHVAAQQGDLNTPAGLKARSTTSTPPRSPGAPVPSRSTAGRRTPR
jgi:peptide/nickel transport system substrate-binding protein